MKPEPVHPPGRLGLLGLGALGGMALLSSELLWRLELLDGALLAYGLPWYASLGALYLLLAGEIARLGIQRGWHATRYRARPAVLGGLVALALPVLAVHGLAPRFLDQLPTTRLILFFMVLAGSGLAGWCVSRAMAARPGLWPMRLLRVLWSPRGLALLLVLLFAHNSYRILAPARPAGDVHASVGVAAEDQPADVIWVRLRGLGHSLGLGGEAEEHPSRTPGLDQWASRGVVFRRASERAWPSLAWPWPLSLLEPWLRKASVGDPTYGETPEQHLAERLEPAGYRCRVVGAEAEAGEPFTSAWAERRARREALLLSRFLGQALAVLGQGLAPRAAPGLERLAPAWMGSTEGDDLLERVRRQAWPQPGEREFLLVSLDPGASGVREADLQVTRLLESLQADPSLGSALLVLSSWPSAGRGVPSRLPARSPLVLAGPGLRAGHRVNEPVSLRQLPDALIGLLGPMESMDPGGSAEEQAGSSSSNPILNSLRLGP